jgi:hypothetical protein
LRFATARRIYNFILRAAAFFSLQKPPEIEEKPGHEHFQGHEAELNRIILDSEDV